MSNHYDSIKLSVEQAAAIAKKYYGIAGTAKALPGELDFNFKIDTKEASFLLKVSRPEADQAYINFQEAILLHVQQDPEIKQTPALQKNKSGDYLTEVKDDKGNIRLVRLLSWLNGRLWSEVNPISDALLTSLGEQAGQLTKSLLSFEHTYAHRELEWDIAQVSWVKHHLKLFKTQQRKIVEYYLELSDEVKDAYDILPCSVVHNDVNDNNIVVTRDLRNPSVHAIIDFGDAIYTQTVNDLAITIAYAAMNKPLPLDAACQVISGYNQHYLLNAEELSQLYHLVALRLIVSVTKSAINREKEPDNKYLLISEKPAWDLLEKWQLIDKNFAYYSFRTACGFEAHPNQTLFNDWAAKQSIDIFSIFNNKLEKVLIPDFGIGSKWVGHEVEQNDNDLLTHKIKLLQKSHPDALIAGGYLETRSIYTTHAYKFESNNGPEYRSTHLGTDFWLKPGTAIYAPLDGSVYAIVNNDLDKDYGPTLIMEHDITASEKFYTLYGHLSLSTLPLHKKGKPIKKGELLGYLGDCNENGGWSPHLHFQLMLDLLGNTSDFPGVASNKDISLWKSICPDPNLLFKQAELNPKKKDTSLIEYRKQHLGKSLSLSYRNPLTILRGSGVYLLDNTGRRYLDTVNNVAHVGHENFAVVRAGQAQMAVLNTNTRYLNEEINDFAKELLKTFPSELSVVHFVNSGSEANELALRMAKTVTGQSDMIAVEVGYHGNTNACIEVSSYKFDGKGGAGAPPYTHIVPLPDAYRGLYQGNGTGPKYAAHIQTEIEKVQSLGRNIAGFICESIISCGGQIELPDNYLKSAYESVRNTGGICIADEVQVGCGRVGSEFWGFQLHKVVPDIVTIGKPIGNGHPLAAVVCTREIADAFANGMEYFNTFGGNPVSCAIGKEVLRVIERENLQKNALDTGNFLKSELKRLQKMYPIIADVRGQGLFLGFELASAEKNPLPDQTDYLANRMKELGILMSVDGPDHNVIKIKPPITFSKDHATELIQRLEQVFDEDYMRLY